ncbi:MAG: PKD domain-containing protein [candidate division Zixibacteria bacterium]|nr:PKD domain-containing protein [candidate division Zixibacteria bacterium]
MFRKFKAPFLLSNALLVLFLAQSPNLEAETDASLRIADMFAGLDPNSPQFLASPQGAAITELNVEVDYMVDTDHTHILYQAEIDALVAMFACQGITLTIDLSDAIPHTDVLLSNGFGVFNNPATDGYLGIKNAFFDHSGQPGWHYCVMGHNYEGTTSSGLAEIFGDDFIVTLGSFSAQVGTSFDRAGTFAHEFGHNLGLTHAGNQNENILTQFKPNYLSVMTYRYQLSGGIRYAMFCSGLADSCMPIRKLDYSHGLRPSLDENALDERIGMGLGPVDWNCNAVIDTTPVVVDIAGYPCAGGTSFQVNTDYDDWSNIVDVTFTYGRGALTDRPHVTCVTPEELEDFKLAAGFDCNNEPAIFVEPCEYPFNDADGDGPGDLCDNCPEVFDPFQRDENMDGLGDVCLHATMDANVTLGFIPFDVNFTGTTDLTPNNWTWSFGDGDSSNSQNPSHPYTTLGFYDVSMEVQASEGDYTAYKTAYIKALADTLVGIDALAVPGNQVEFLIYANNSTPLRYFEIVFSWKGSIGLGFMSASSSGLRSSVMPTQGLINVDPFQQRAAYSFLADADTSTWLSSDTGAVLKLTFSVPGGADGTDTIKYTSFSGLSTEFETESFSFQPYLIEGVISTNLTCCNIPGDADDGGDVNIGDAIFIVNYAFVEGSPAPPCCDQADADGGDDVNIGDAIYIVKFAFEQGSPAPACPNPGGLVCP